MAGFYNNIDNVIFDLGGVLIDLRRERAIEALVRLGIDDADRLLGLYRQEGPFLQLETGEISAARFFDLLLAKAKPGTSAEDIEDAFNRFLIDLPPYRLDLLMSLRKMGKRVYALSNTNAVMYNSWIKRAFSRCGYKIHDYFDGIVTSFEEGRCKPDVEIFRTVLRRFALHPGKTVLLDDSKDNCLAAQETGMRTFLIDNSIPGSSVRAIVNGILNLKYN